MHSLKSLYSALLATLMLTLCVPATAQIRLLEQSYEVWPALIVLPGSPGESLALRKCPSCASTSIATNTATLYQVGGENLSLPDFAAFLRQHPGVQVTVMTNMKGDLITRVRVAAAPPTPASSP